VHFRDWTVAEHLTGGTFSSGCQAVFSSDDVDEVDGP